jgi:hypothetical protein
VRWSGPPEPRLGDTAAKTLLLLFATAAGCTLVNDFTTLQGGGGLQPAGGGGSGGENSTPNPCASGLERGVCGDGEKCTLASPAQGTEGGFVCGPSGPAEAWNVCSADEDCVDGTWCDAFTAVCKPWCQVAEECPASGRCVTARRHDNTAILGLTVCTAHCSVDEIKLCGPGANCVIEDLEDAEGDCAIAGEVNAGCPCDADNLCSPGLHCAADGNCYAWCQTDIGGSCAGGTCGAPITDYQGHPFGLCSAINCPKG